MSGNAVGGIVGGILGAVIVAACVFALAKKTRKTRRRKSGRLSSFQDADMFPSHPRQFPPPLQSSTANQTNVATTAAAYGAAAATATTNYGSMTTPVAAGSAYPYHHQQQQQMLYNSTFSPPPMTQPLPPLPAAAPPVVQEQDPWQLPPIGTYTVQSTYTPTLDDELYIQPGDQVQIYTEYDDGWCLAINLTRGRARGVFPKHCVLSPSPTMTESTLSQQNDKHHSKRGSSLFNEHRYSRQWCE